MSAWDRIAATLASEFSDVADLESIVRVVLRLLMAALLGGLLGLQREQHGKEAGVRTHMLVALGSALFVLVPLQAGADPQDLSRVIQGVIAGVGFLCAGTIIRVTGEDHIRGTDDGRGHLAHGGDRHRRRAGARNHCRAEYPPGAWHPGSRRVRSGGCSANAQAQRRSSHTDERINSGDFLHQSRRGASLASASTLGDTACSSFISATRTTRPGPCGPGCCSSRRAYRSKRSWCASMPSTRTRPSSRPSSP